MKGIRNRVLLVFVAAVLMLTGCASSPQGGQTAEATVTATPDPLYSIHCIRRVGRNDLCYAGKMLLGDNALLEKAARDYCTNATLSWCSIHIWADEASVAQAFPLTEAENASRIARLYMENNTATMCFELYDQGKSVSLTEGCRP